MIRKAFVVDTRTENPHDVTITRITYDPDSVACTIMPSACVYTGCESSTKTVTADKGTGMTINIEIDKKTGDPVTNKYFTGLRIVSTRKEAEKIAQNYIRTLGEFDVRRRDLESERRKAIEDARAGKDRPEDKPKASYITSPAPTFRSLKPEDLPLVTYTGMVSG